MDEVARGIASAFHRMEVHPPLILNTAQLESMLECARLTTGFQVIYSYMSDGSGDVLVGNNAASARDDSDDDDGDGAWLNAQGEELHSPMGPLSNPPR